MGSNKRELQFMACLCVASFCRHFGIRHPFITEFITHRIGLLRSHDLAVWENDGMQLPITGMGDPLPDEVLVVVPDQLRADFLTLISNAAEVGNVDLWGDDTEHPSRFLNECVAILSRHDISSPVGPIKTATVGWGNPLTDPAFNVLVARHAEMLDGYLR